MFYDAFDTVTQVIAYCDSEEEFNRQMDALHADLLEYHRLYDIYNDYDGITNIKTINDNAGLAPVTVDDKILGMLELAQTMYDTTGGKLNIAMGSGSAQSPFSSAPVLKSVRCILPAPLLVAEHPNQPHNVSAPVD